MAANLYVHFPFCRSRCSYCSLYSRVGASPADRVAYVARIADAITQAFKSTNAQTLSTLYFGGGSPALCDLSPLRIPLKQWKPGQTCFPLFEFTVELHPLDVTPAKLDELKSIGVNRISMGVQSLDDATLRAMGRGYTASDAARAFALIKSRFDNAGIDLIIGYPNDSIKWLDSLRDWGLTHCSAYSLQNERGLKDVPDDDIVLDRIRTVAVFLKSLGLERYEISNYASPGFECRHNFAVWRGEDYIGLGDGAYGREGLKRTRGILQNSVNGERGTGNRERGTGNGKRSENSLIAYKTTEVSPFEDLKERTLFRLRTRDGIDSSQFPEWRPTLDRFVSEGLLVKVGESVYRLTERGTEVCDAILEELV
ncbi:MAG: coproporphyrinogen III oxidase family protein [Kiritimatiellae bacterium]|nr:coproporphyrinogen III oxidase family protein [Kiritimatiellia bacterium]